MLELNLSKDIVQYPMPTNQYVNVAGTKTQIVLHHTASGPNPFAVIDYWNSTSERVATPVVIGGFGQHDGIIAQGYSSKFYAGHIGRAHGIDKWGLPYFDYSSISIGVEICNWGYLTKTSKGFVNYVGGVVPDNQVFELLTQYRGFKYFQKYTPKQIDAVEKLLRYWNKIYNIPLTYKEKEMWELSKDAHNKVPGVYTHNSYRLDKSDIFPDPAMINMLKSL